MKHKQGCYLKANKFAKVFRALANIPSQIDLLGDGLWVNTYNAAFKDSALSSASQGKSISLRPK